MILVYVIFLEFMVTIVMLCIDLTIIYTVVLGYYYVLSQDALGT